MARCCGVVRTGPEVCEERRALFRVAEVRVTTHYDSGGGAGIKGCSLFESTAKVVVAAAGFSLSSELPNNPLAAPLLHKLLLFTGAGGGNGRHAIWCDL